MEEIMYLAYWKNTPWRVNIGFLFTISQRILYIKVVVCFSGGFRYLLFFFIFFSPQLLGKDEKPLLHQKLPSLKPTVRTWKCAETQK